MGGAVGDSSGRGGSRDASVHDRGGGRARARAACYRRAGGSSGVEARRAGEFVGPKELQAHRP